MLVLCEFSHPLVGEAQSKYIKTDMKQVLCIDVSEDIGNQQSRKLFKHICVLPISHGQGWCFIPRQEGNPLKKLLNLDLQDQSTAKCFQKCSTKTNGGTPCIYDRTCAKTPSTRKIKGSQTNFMKQVRSCSFEDKCC